MYGCYVHLRIVHQTVGLAWMNHCTYCPGNGVSTVIFCHQHASATQRIEPGGQTVGPPATMQVRLTPCAFHACEFGPFPAETIKMAGAQAVGRPNTGSSSAAGGYKPYPTATTRVRLAPYLLHACEFNSISLSIHGLMVSVDAWCTGEPGYKSLLRHFFQNLTQHLALPESLYRDIIMRFLNSVFS